MFCYPTPLVKKQKKFAGPPFLKSDVIGID